MYVLNLLVWRAAKHAYELCCDALDAEGLPVKMTAGAKCSDEPSPDVKWVLWKPVLVWNRMRQMLFLDRYRRVYRG